MSVVWDLQTVPHQPYTYQFSYLCYLHTCNNHTIYEHILIKPDFPILP